MCLSNLDIVYDYVLTSVCYPYFIFGFVSEVGTKGRSIFFRQSIVSDD